MTDLADVTLHIKGEKRVKRKQVVHTVWVQFNHWVNYHDGSTGFEIFDTENEDMVPQDEIEAALKLHIEKLQKEALC